MVEILRAVYQKADLIILDEPNSALTDQETQALFATMRRMKGQGRSFLLVSHRLDEVFSIADEVTILRDGRLITTQPCAQLTLRDAITMMVGDDQAGESVEPPVAREALAPIVLEVRSLAASTLADVSFTVSKGEIVGFAGLEGSERCARV